MYLVRTVLIFSPQSPFKARYIGETTVLSTRVECTALPHELWYIGISHACARFS